MTEVTLGICLLGSGRMGKIYAQLAARHPTTRLVSIVNPNLRSALALSEVYGGHATDNSAAAIADPDVDAIIISTPTPTHLEYITMAAKSGKAILCEKPLDLSPERVEQCCEVLERHPVTFALGFNRRYDPSINALCQAVHRGEIGDLHQLILTSRDPAPPPISYIKSSGGYFHDSSVHDLDLARWIMGEEPVEVYATASCLVDPAIGALGDVDTTMIVLRTDSGRLCHINNSRRAVYGFDQRIEAFGSKGMIQTQNQRDVGILRSDKSRTNAQTPLKHFFLERYAQSFERQFDDFVKVTVSGGQPMIDHHDGKAAFKLAMACIRAYREGRSMPL